MRIALYYGTFYKNKDGVARTAYQLVEHLLSQGHEVHLWTPEVSEDTLEGVTFHHFPSLPVPLYPSYRFALPRHGFLKEMDEFDPDVIHTSTPDLIGLLIGIHANKRGVPLVSAYHTDFPSYLKYYHISLFSGMLWWFLRYFYRKCCVVLCPTKRIMRTLEEHGINNVKVWSRGIDTYCFNPSKRRSDLRKRWKAEGKVVVLFTGRFVYYKDIDVVIKVYQRIMEGRFKERTIFVMVGHGPEEDVLKREMSKAIFPGYLNGEDLYAAYASADVFLFPSRTETFGNVVQEAIASGLPAIVSDVGGCREIVEGSGCGIVCEGGNIQSFHDALVTLIENENDRHHMIENGQSYVNERTWFNVNQEIMRIYERMVQR
ncbi:MAG: glycosyltransferase family 1 protein [Candidatus Thermoplasmatota archaeon]|nr:glycosyltransferase family 1 protein [Candidatus Thermoplasmatota archaeon]